jgi:hypothetical protein
MTIDHLQGNPLHRFSNPYFGPLGFFTAALGFVFLSGLVAGGAYQSELTLAGPRSMLRRLLRRTRALYITHMFVFSLVLGAIVLHVRGTDRWHLGLLQTSPWKGAALGVTLAYEPGYFGILPMYLLFVLFTPIALWQFSRGNVWRVLAASALLWLVSGLLIRLPEHAQSVDFGAFNPLAYQFVFLAGLAFGTRRLSIERLPGGVQNWLVGTAVIVATACLILRWQYAVEGSAIIPFDSFTAGFSAKQLGPLRLLNFAAFGLVLYWLCRKVRWQDVRSRGFVWLRFVGRHSLPVFAWSILVTYAALALLPSDLNAGFGLILIVAVTASLSIPAQVHAMIRTRRATPKWDFPHRDPHAAQVAPSVHLASASSHAVP